MLGKYLFDNFIKNIVELILIELFFLVVFKQQS